MKTLILLLSLSALILSGCAFAKPTLDPKTTLLNCETTDQRSLTLTEHGGQILLSLTGKTRQIVARQSSQKTVYAPKDPSSGQDIASVIFVSNTQDQSYTLFSDKTTAPIRAGLIVENKDGRQKILCHSGKIPFNRLHTLTDTQMERLLPLPKSH